MERTLWIVDPAEWPPSETEVSTATQAGAAEIVRGVPAPFADLLAPDAVGLVTVQVPEPEPVEPQPTAEERIAQLEAIIAALVEAP